MRPWQSHGHLLVLNNGHSKSQAGWEVLRVASPFHLDLMHSFTEVLDVGEESRLAVLGSRPRISGANHCDHDRPGE
jgi:hypothetical protein